MHRRILLSIPCTMAVVLSACFLKPQGPTLKTQLEESRIKMSQVESSLQQTAAELKDAEKARIQFWFCVFAPLWHFIINVQHSPD